MARLAVVRGHPDATQDFLYAIDDRVLMHSDMGMYPGAHIPPAAPGQQDAHCGATRPAQQKHESVYGFLLIDVLPRGVRLGF